MLRINQIKLSLDYTEKDLEDSIVAFLHIDLKDLLDYKIIKRSIDARDKSRIKFVFSIDVSLKEENVVLKRRHKPNLVKKSKEIKYKYIGKATKGFPPSEEERPVIVGAGPCGYFAALILAQMGFKPLLLERGEPVKDRSIRAYGFWAGRCKLGVDSNVQFGEGGAGTFSDGKLYSKISDPDNYRRKVLNEFVESGANKEILISHRPHIGTFKLAAIVRRFRSRIQDLGGEIRFGSKMEELILEKKITKNIDGKDLEVKGLKLADGSIIKTRYVILALGHSARDSFRMLDKVGVYLEQKLFAVGFRIEHLQLEIDKERWGELYGHVDLGRAEYKLVYHSSNGRNVYSFCMCPGGQVVGATSNKDCVVTNGMSQHTRNEKNANSALVVNLEKQDLLGFERWPGDPLAGIAFQEELEKKAFEMGGKNYFAPIQRLEDFIASSTSIQLGPIIPSYLPGVRLANLNDSLPKPFIFAIRESLPYFSRKFSFFMDPDAILTGLETRTSSPIRIKRDSELESLNVVGLIPAGEGAGYAGGIMSAAIDGIKAAESIARKILRG